MRPNRPFVAILGGSKVSDKVGVIDALIDKADTIIIGGGMCFTFLLAQGKAVGTSLKEEDWVERAGDMIEKAHAAGVKLLLPVDVVAADAFAEDARTQVCSADAIPADMMGLDIGPETEKIYAAAIAEGSTVFWNGPMGVFEMKAFEHGTNAVAEAVAANKAGRHDHRRRRQRCRGEQVRARRRDDVHFHGRRRVDGARRGQGAAGRRGFELTGGLRSGALRKRGALRKPAAADGATHIAPSANRLVVFTWKGAGMSRKPIIAGNWKMNMTPAESVVLSQGVSNRYARGWDKVDVVLCPPAIDLRSVVTVLDFDKSRIDVGAQNVHWEPSGAFTGEISIPMLKDVGCAWCIVGHSERREMFAETDMQVNRKVRALLEAGVKPIVCVGESLTVREEGKAERFVCDQVRAALAGIEADEAAAACIAYEPIWAIGTGRTATPEQAQDMAAAIRETLRALVGDDAAEQMRILYGGSMKPENAEAFLACPDIDGGLIGGAALKADDFAELVLIAAAGR